MYLFYTQFCNLKKRRNIPSATFFLKHFSKFVSRVYNQNLLFVCCFFSLMICYFFNLTWNGKTNYYYSFFSCLEWSIHWQDKLSANSSISHTGIYKSGLLIIQGRDSHSRLPNYNLYSFHSLSVLIICCCKLFAQFSPPIFQSIIPSSCDKRPYC